MRISEADDPVREPSGSTNSVAKNPQAGEAFCCALYYYPAPRIPSKASTRIHTIVNDPSTNSPEQHHIEVQITRHPSVEAFPKDWPKERAHLLPRPLFTNFGDEYRLFPRLSSGSYGDSIAFRRGQYLVFISWGDEPPEPERIRQVAALVDESILKAIGR